MEIDLDKLKATAQHHIRRGDAMQMDPKVIFHLAELASLVKPTAECNACEWQGLLSDTVYCGSVGPLCPECYETCEATQPAHLAKDIPPEQQAQFKTSIAKALGKGGE